MGSGEGSIDCVDLKRRFGSTMEYGESLFQIYNDVDLAFYTSIMLDESHNLAIGLRTIKDIFHKWPRQYIFLSTITSLLSFATYTY